MNIAVNLMNDVPLFLPLLWKKEKKTLNVSIIGNGMIAQEAFKAVFWCGQMYGTTLTINLVSEDANELKNILEEKCPELFESCKKIRTF